jgi:hypothetical protein
MGWGSRTTSNYTHNHTGHYAAAGEAVCKALFMGGVTRRFPTLKCAFLEGGVGWAAALYAGLITRWEKRNPFGARLRAIFSSDIGHWDVPDMTEVLAEAYTLVEEEVMTDADFRDFVFTNPVTLWTGMNPDFFKGTVVEQEVDHLLAVRVK